MSDAELSDIADDDDIVRRYEREDDAEVNRYDGMEDGYRDVSDDDVKSGAEEAEVQATRVDPPTQKKHITRKMVVLNTERLKGPKGVHTIEKLFEGFKFHGKGHEKKDLDRVMKRLEYWAYRIFPKLDFDDFLAKCEHLGHKKDLQTHLKKYRLGMITADQNMCTENDIIEEEEAEIDAAILTNESELQPGNDDFQRLFDETT